MWTAIRNWLLFKLAGGCTVVLNAKLDNGTMKYRKKSVVVEAYRFTKATFNRDSYPVWLKETMQGDWDNAVIKLWSQYGGKVIGGKIKTLEGEMEVSEGDWIVKGVNGELYACKPDIFNMTYEVAE